MERETSPPLTPHWITFPEHPRVNFRERQRASWSTLYNCTLTGNSASHGGGADSCALYNCIVYDNDRDNDSLDCTFHYSCTTPLPPGAGNIDADPQFVDAAAGNYRLQPTSPCIDAGTSLSANITNDLVGNPRPLDGNGDGMPVFDMGAYEYRPYPVTLYVWQESGGPIPPYAGWASAAHTIQDAVDAAQAGDTVIVTNGIYASGGRAIHGIMTNRVTIDRAITVQSVNGPEVTVMQGAGPLGDGAVRCAYVGNQAILNGFTLANGHTRTVDHPENERSGGGVWCESTGVVSNCVLTGNSAYYSGGGAWGGTLHNCTLSGNLADVGAGVEDCTLYSCTLATNSARSEAGGAYWSTLYNCTLSGNSTRSQGGGASLSTLYSCTLVGNTAELAEGGGTSLGTLYNCSLVGNAAWEGGGAANSALYNCTVTGNSARSQGGGTAWCRLYNSIVYYNTAPDGPNYAGAASASLNYSCTTPLPASGTGNIAAEPAFVDVATGDLRLQYGSPCIDAGTNQDWMLTATDLNNNPRIIRNRVDMGAYEFYLLPTISQEPAKVTVALGTPATFGVVAAGDEPLSFQWYLNGNRALTGQTNATLSLPTVRSSDAGGYTVVVSNPFGAVTSSIATLTVLTTPVVFAVQIVSGARGTEVLLPVVVTNFTRVTSFQFSMHHDPATVTYVAVEPTLPGLSTGNFGNPEPGTLTVSWDDPSLQGATLVDGATVFSVRLRLVGDWCSSTAVTIDGTPTAMEATGLVNNQLQALVLGKLDGQVNILCQFVISGRFDLCPSGLTVPAVQVALTGDQSVASTTGCDGAYLFNASAGGNYAVIPSKQTGAAPGVSSLDIVLIRRHILAMTALDQPCRLIAADVNGSESITTFDIVLMRQVILAITNVLPAGSWAFVPSDWVPEDPTHPWPYTGQRSYSGLGQEQVNQDFLAIKLGDVNGSWKDEVLCPSGQGGQLEIAPTVTFAASTASAAVGSAATVSVIVGGFTNVTSAQFTLQWDPALMEFVSVGGLGLPELTAGQFNTNLTSTGRLPFAWDDPTGAGVTRAEGSTIFAVQFRAVSNLCAASEILIAGTPTGREVTVNAATAQFSSHNGQVTFSPEFEPPEWLPGGSLRLTLLGTVPEGEVEIQASSTVLFQDWTVLLRTNLNSQLIWMDSEALKFKQRFYRAVMISNEP